MIPFSYFSEPESSSFVGETSFWKSSLRIFAVVAALLKRLRARLAWLRHAAFSD
jgi:hypothetical protein